MAAADAVAAFGLLTLPSPLVDEPGILYLHEAADADPDLLGARIAAGRYGKPFVLEQDGRRSLYFNLRFQQSCMRIDDPHALELAYTRAMMAFLLFQPRPRRLLLLGLGGGSLAKFCHRHLPATELTAVEIDGAVIGFRTAFGLPPDGERFRIIHADAVSYLADGAGRHDVILIDVFDDAGVAPALTAPGFYENVHRCLGGNGMLVMNIAGDKDDYAAHVARIRDVFDDAVMAMSVRDDGNYILFAFRNAQTPRWTWMRSIALDLQRRLGLDFPQLAQQLERGDKLRLAQRLGR